jgi:PST family polysaccharide transporter
LPEEPEFEGQSIHESAGLRRVVVSGIRWNAVGTAFSYGVRIGQSIALARLLTPQDYGVVGIAGPAIAMLNLLADMGFGAALVQRKTDDISRYAYSAFWTLISVSLVLMSVFVVFIPGLSNFYDDERLEAVFYVMTIGFLINAVMIVPKALVERQMRFREFNVISTIATLSAAVVAIGMAFLGFGYWSLIVPPILLMFLIAVSCMWIARWFPGLHFSVSALKEIFSFSFTLFLARLLYYLGFNGRNLIIGKYLDSTVFGYFHFAMARSQQPMSIVIGQYYSVTYSAFSRLQDNPRRLLERYYEAASLLSFIMFPMATLLILWADYIVPVIFGSQWYPAIFPFQMFTLFMIIYTFTSTPGMLIQAMGKPKILLYSNLIKTPILLVGLIMLMQNGGGLFEVSIFLPAVEGLVLIPINLYIWYYLGAKALPLWQAHGPSLLISLSIAFFSVWFKGFAEQLAMLQVVILILGVMGATGIYWGLSFIFNRNSVTLFLDFARRFVKR